MSELGLARGCLANSSRRRTAPVVIAMLMSLVASLLLTTSVFAAPPTDDVLRSFQSHAHYDRLFDHARKKGAVRVIVGFDLDAPFDSAAVVDMSDVSAMKARRRGIVNRQDLIMGRLPTVALAKSTRFRSIPFMGLELNAYELDAISRMSEVTSIREDELDSPTLSDTIPLIGADVAWVNGFTGSGQAVAILDTGVDSSHSFLSGRVVSEACFSTTNSIATTLCPGNTDAEIGLGSGVNCTGISSCDHGTHVAGISAGQGTTFSGVAKETGIIAIQVFSQFNDEVICSPSPAPCVKSYISDQILALDHVFSLRNTYSIAAVNLSLGGGKYTDQATCDSVNAARKAAIDNLRAVGIASVISSGNSGYSDGLDSPGCISTAVSVGSTTKSDVVASYSNSASFLSLLAPGSSIYSSIPGGGYLYKSGTSMAASHVTGAWAVIKNARPSATVDEILSDLQTYGVPIVDARNGVTKSRIRIDTIPGIDIAGLTITTTSLVSGAVGVAYNDTLTASAGVLPYTWSIVSGSLPAGLSLDPATGVISGDPQVAGISSFTVQVIDNVGDVATKPFSISVQAAGMLDVVLSADNLAEVYLNGVYLGHSSDWRQSSQYTVALQSGNNVLAVKGVDLGGPAGLIAELVWNENTAFTDTGWKVSTTAQTGWERLGYDDTAWEKAASYGAYGVSPWGARVAGFSSGSPAQWIWSADNAADDVAYFRYNFFVGNAPLAIADETLPGGVEGQSYETTLTAGGGTLPYTWLVTAGSLPVGLSLDPSTGVISGIPSVVGASDFTVQVTDNAADTATMDFSITIQAAATGNLDVTLTADNLLEVYLNGVYLGFSSDWRQSSHYTAALMSGNNVLAVKGTDLGGPAGLIAELSWDGDSAISDASWKVSTTAPLGWEQQAYDDAAWSLATSYGAYGVAPWYERVNGISTGSTAEWIWSADNVDDDVAFFRYMFTVP